MAMSGHPLPPISGFRCKSLNHNGLRNGRPKGVGHRPQASRFAITCSTAILYGKHCPNFACPGGHIPDTLRTPYCPPGQVPAIIMAAQRHVCVPFCSPGRGRAQGRVRGRQATPGCRRTAAAHNGTTHPTATPKHTKHKPNWQGWWKWVAYTAYESRSSS